MKSCLADWQGKKTRQLATWRLSWLRRLWCSPCNPNKHQDTRHLADHPEPTATACSKFVITARPDLSIQRQSRVRDTIIDNLDLDSNWNVSFVCLQLLIQAFIYFCIDMECFVVQYLTWNFMIINKYLRRISVYFWLEMSILSLYIFRHTPTQTATIAKQYAT